MYGAPGRRVRTFTASKTLHREKSVFPEKQIRQFSIEENPTFLYT